MGKKDATICGIHSVQAVLNNKPEYVLEVWIQKEKENNRLQNIHNHCKELGVNVRFVEKITLDNKVETQHQGICATVKSTGVYQKTELISFLDSLASPPFLLILDGITDSHNLGACLRSANAAGVDAIILPKDKSAKVSATVSKVACGAAEVTPIITVTNLSRTMALLKKRGIWLFGAAGEAKLSIFETQLPDALAIVMGAEESGLRRLTSEQCDELIKIPMFGSVKSLNVSVATAICLFESVRQRMTLI